MAKFKFADLCDKPLSAADYLEVTHNFGTVFVEDIPRMGLSERDQARRFITFIDGECSSRPKAESDGRSRAQGALLTLFAVACYENKVLLPASHGQV